MKIAVAADLHFGLTGEEALTKLRASLLREGLDFVVLAGDLGEPLTRFEKCLAFFSVFGSRVAVLAGNHDVWHSRGPYGSRELWQTKLPQSVAAHGFTWLESSAVTLGNVAIVGTIAWYDYTARAPGFEGKSNKDFFRTKAAYNNDGVFIDWDWTDIEFAGRVAKPFLARLAHAQNDPAVEHIVVVTHVPVFPEQKVFIKKWSNGGDAYYGNWSLGREIEPFSKVRIAVAGHTHMGVLASHKCPDGRRLDVVTIGSDYGKPAYHLIDTAAMNPLV